METLALKSRPRSLSNKPLQSMSKNLTNLAKYSVSPSSRRTLLKNFSSFLKTPSNQSKDFQSLYNSSCSKPIQKPSLSVKKRSTDSLIKPSPRNIVNLKTPKTPSRKILNSNPILLTPHRKIKLLAHPSKFLTSSKRSLKVSKSQKLEIHEKSSKSQIQKITFKTKTGTVNGRTKPNNQDDLFAINNFANCKNQLFLGVMDGHGIHGHEVSAFVKRNLPIFIENSLPYDSNSHLVANYSDTSEVVLNKIQKAIHAGFLNTHKNLVTKRQIDINYSGTTAVSVLIRNKYCICANVGDSRAVIGRLDTVWYPIGISNDHKPNSEGEKKRIEECGGRIEPFKEENGEFIGPDRVWLKDEQLPGLAMSRSIGDLVAARVGVSSEPEIILHELTPHDKFLIIASDGIWEFIDSHECITIISEFYEKGQIEEAASELINEAIKRWHKEDNIVDDITLVLVFFSS